jgi:PAS domain S-box-containing protein
MMAGSPLLDGAMAANFASVWRQDTSDGETAERQRDASIRMLFEYNPVAMYVFDIETLRFLEVNQAALQQYRYTREKFLSLIAKDIRPPEEVARMQQGLAEAKPGVFERLGRWRHMRSDGTIIHVENLAYRLPFGSRPADLIVAIDVTERVHAEEALRASEARLRRSEQHLAEAQRLAAIGSWELDFASGRFHWSDELFRIYGIEPQSRELDIEPCWRWAIIPIAISSAEPSPTRSPARRRAASIFASGAATARSARSIARARRSAIPAAASPACSAPSRT